MEKTTINPKLRAAIKLRHLVEAIHTDWAQLAAVGVTVRKQLAEAGELMKAHGDEHRRARFDTLAAAIQVESTALEAMLSNADKALKQGSPIDPSTDWGTMQGHLHAVEALFRQMQELCADASDPTNASDWQALWTVVRANLAVIHGICTSAYLKARMIAELSGEEADELTRTIIKHIPRSFSLAEADRYEHDYLAAMDQIKEDSAKKSNLWDRFLNILAGMVPFEESPAERVMMQRWIEGEKGAL
ncbi:MAG: hypothetical protein IT229_00885 [Flavobacteriales bacterium]|nr:hypothetical protein [Flavobacteriales bacterium]